MSKRGLGVATLAMLTAVIACGKIEEAPKVTSTLIYDLQQDLLYCSTTEESNKFFPGVGSFKFGSSTTCANESFNVDAGDEILMKVTISTGLEAGERIDGVLTHKDNGGNVQNPWTISLCNDFNQPTRFAFHFRFSTAPPTSGLSCREDTVTELPFKENAPVRGDYVLRFEKGLMYPATITMNVRKDVTTSAGMTDRCPFEKGSEAVCYVGPPCGDGRCEPDEKGKCNADCKPDPPIIATPNPPKPGSR